MLISDYQADERRAKIYFSAVLRSLDKRLNLELMTAASRYQLRPFHGHVTAIDMAGANGGFARYNLTVEPWTAFLARGRDSRIVSVQPSHL